jgi:hypothetical protein
MKKILTLSLTIFALWAISTFVIGNQTQQELENYIIKSNKLYATSGIKLTLREYNKSFLHSNAQIELNIIDPTVVKLLEQDYLLPLKMDYKIEHGPLFFEDGLGFGLAKIKHHLLLSSIFKEKAKKEFLELVKDDVNLNTDVVISFSKEANYKLLSDEMKFNIENKAFLMTPFTISGKSNLESFKGTALMNIEHIQVKEENSSNGFDIKGLTFDIDMKEFLENSLVFGDFKLSINNLLIKDNTNPQLSNVDVALHGTMRNKRTSQSTMSSVFEGDIDFRNTLLPDEYKSLQTVYLKMNLENLGIKGMLEFQQSAQNMQEAQNRLIAQIQTANQKDMQKLFIQFGTIQEEMINQIVHSLNTLLIKDKTTIAYELDLETKDKKRTEAMSKIGYTGDIEFKGTMEELTKKVKRELFSLISLNVDIKLNKAHLSLIPNAPILKQQIEMGVKEGFVKDNNETYSLHGQYQNKELMVNDNNLTSTVLPFLMMATQI